MVEVWDTSGISLSSRLEGVLTHVGSPSTEVPGTLGEWPRTLGKWPCEI